MVSLFMAVVLGILIPPEPGPLHTARSAAEAILAQQTSDGAITMGKVGSKESTVISYFSCFAARGLLDVYRRTRESNYLHGALAWVDWYAAHQNADGTICDYKGRSGTWKSTGHFDSSDSYAAVYLSLVQDLYSETKDKTWVVRHSPSIQLAIKGIDLTMQPSGLTTAKPAYPVMYTMDNVETLQGLRDAASLCQEIGEAELAKKERGQAQKMKQSILSLLWDESESAYRIGIQTDGGKMGGLEKWYPDVMANLMAVAWLPSSDRNRDLFGRLYKRFGSEVPHEVKSVDDLEKMIWWAWAAKGAGDRDLLGTLQRRMAGFKAICQDGCDCGNLGHVARLMAER
ncbi:MAG TPA: hypothetical protein VG944_09355 [Fimbriimonas sp.]|nr:hypothetical protein [Fimbriimonas sp.]